MIWFRVILALSIICNLTESMVLFFCESLNRHIEYEQMTIMHSIINIALLVVYFASRNS